LTHSTKFCRAAFVKRDMRDDNGVPESRPELPDTLNDYLTGVDIPFSNKDNIRQKILRFLIENKGFLKEDITVDREISFAMEEVHVSSVVDISVRLDGLTLMVWKCASGSVVSRERQIIAAARLLEKYVVPFAGVTNGREVELLDASTEKVIGSGFDAIPTRQELLIMGKGLSLRVPHVKKIVYEQRILYTYDAICCPVSPATNRVPSKSPRQKT
jgi:hypothetical protein